MPDFWDSDAGRTHFVGDGCVPAHQISDDSLPAAQAEPAHLDDADQDARDRVLHIHGKLAEQLEMLRLLERKLKLRQDQDLRERVRADTVAVAIEHVETAIEALLRAGQEDDFAV